MRPGLADAPQVAEGQHRDEGEAQRDAMVVPFRERGGDGSHPGRDADGHRQDVVDQQRRPRDQARGLPDVLLGHDVGAAAARIGVDRLAVREGDDEQEHGDHGADRRGEPERRGSRPG